MWYAYIPDKPNLQEVFSGFTDNPFLMKTYTEMMDGYNVNNIIPDDVNFRTMKECMEGMRHIRDYFVGDITGSINNRLFELLENPEIFAARNKLFSIHGKGINHDIVVVNDVIYEHFGELFFTPKEVTKALYDINRLCNQVSVKYMYQYLNDSSEDIQILKLLFSTMYKIWETANNAYQSGGFGRLMYPGSDDGRIATDIFDEPYQIKFYIASEVAKFVWTDSSYFKNLKDDIYDHNIHKSFKDF